MKVTALPTPPDAHLRVVREQPNPGPGFLALRRCDVKVVRDGVESAAITYDVVTRRHQDAVVAVAWFDDPKLGRHVVLRSCVRPPVALREGGGGTLWELPAGLVEDGEPLEVAAARELFEETGARVEASAMAPLGGRTLPAAGIIAEYNYFFHVRIDPGAVEDAPGDDTPLEEGGAVIALPVAVALDLCRRGAFPDAKTEIGVRRLAELA